MGVILSPAAWAARGIGPLGPHTGLLATPMLHVGSPGVLLTLPGFRARERACPRALSSLVPTHPSRSPSAQHWSWTLPGGEGKEVSPSPSCRQLTSLSSCWRATEQNQLPRESSLVELVQRAWVDWGTGPTGCGSASIGLGAAWSSKVRRHTCQTFRYCDFRNRRTEVKEWSFFLWTVTIPQVAARRRKAHPEIVPGACGQQWEPPPWT